jgi:phosphatidylglycerol:prolipoprotein diacylglycerol transferase
LVVLPILFVANRRYNARGFNFILFPALYLPVRFGLDFLRVVDARYAGLTPAQWVALVAFVSLPIIWARVRTARSA